MQISAPNPLQVMGASKGPKWHQCPDGVLIDESGLSDFFGVPKQGRGSVYVPPARPPLPGGGELMPFDRGLDDDSLRESIGYIVLQVPREKFEKYVLADNPKYAILARILSAGLRVRIYRSCDPAQSPTDTQTIFMEVYFGGEDRLVYSAWRKKYEVLLDARRLRQSDVQRNKQLNREAIRLGVVDLFDDESKPEVKEAVDLANGDKNAMFAIPRPSPGFVPEFLRAWLCGWPVCGCKRQLPMEDIKDQDVYSCMHVPLDPSPGAGESAWKLFHVHEETGTVLSEAQCLRALESAMVDSSKEGGAGLSLDADQKWVQHVFAQPKEAERRALESEWLSALSMPWDQPFERIRAYGGERVGFYFFFAGYLTLSLVLPTVLGVCLWLNQVIYNEPGVVWAPLYALTVGLWAAFMYEFYKRAQATVAQRWGMSDWSQRQTIRASYHDSSVSNERRSPVTGIRGDMLGNSMMRQLRWALSHGILTFIIGLVIVVFMSVFLAQISLKQLDAEENESSMFNGWGTTIAQVINALAINLMSFLYSMLAEWLTELEMQPTETAQEESAIVKGATFQLINSFTPLFYIAFIKPNVANLYGQSTQERCTNDDCLLELQGQLQSLVITRLVVNNAMQLLGPYLAPLAFAALRKCSCGYLDSVLGKEPGKPHPQESDVDREARRARFDTYEQYMQQLVLFGYTSLFVVSFPLAPLILLISNYIELRVDAYSFLHSSARPIPAGASGIGAWGPFVALVSYMACATNLAVALFTNSNLQLFAVDEDSPASRRLDGGAEFAPAEEEESVGLLFPRFLGSSPSNATGLGDGLEEEGADTGFGLGVRATVFIIAEHLLLFLVYLVSEFIPDVPEDTRNRALRQEYLEAKHVRGDLDSIDDVLVEAGITPDTEPAPGEEGEEDSSSSSSSDSDEEAAAKKEARKKQQRRQITPGFGTPAQSQAQAQAASNPLRANGPAGPSLMPPDPEVAVANASSPTAGIRRKGSFHAPGAARRKRDECLASGTATASGGARGGLGPGAGAPRIGSGATRGAGSKQRSGNHRVHRHKRGIEVCSFSPETLHARERARARARGISAKGGSKAGFSGTPAIAGGYGAGLMDRSSGAQAGERAIREIRVYGRSLKTIRRSIGLDHLRVCDENWEEVEQPTQGGHPSLKALVVGESQSAAVMVRAPRVEHTFGELFRRQQQHAAVAMDAEHTSVRTDMKKVVQTQPEQQEQQEQQERGVDGERAGSAYQQGGASRVVQRGAFSSESIRGSGLELAGVHHEEEDSSSDDESEEETEQA